MEKPKLSYEQYYNIYGCGEVVKIPQNEFTFYARLATEEVAGMCTGDEKAENEESVLLCICEVAEAIYSSRKQGNIESENIDGYSVKYKSVPDLSREIRGIVLKHLGTTNMVYKGVEA